MGFTDNPAIIGTGKNAEYERYSDRSRLSLATESIKNAIDDAGLEPDDIDGYISNIGAPSGINYERLVEALGLDIDYASFYWAHGRWIATAVAQAAMAIKEGLAENIIVGHCSKHSVGSQIRGTDIQQISIADLGSLSEHGEKPWYGFASPSADSALAARYYMEKYGATSEDLGHIAISLRKHASMTPGSQYQEEMTMEDHQASRYVVEPLHLLDCCPLSDGGAYLVVTNAENAQSASNDPVHIAGIEGLKASREEYSFTRPGIGIRTQQEFEYEPDYKVNRVYDRAGITRDDIDAFYLYDAFTPTVWMNLERWGFCEAGEAYKFCRDGNIEVGGELPVNTHGGLISNGHVGGYNHLWEMFNQLQGRCGERQVKNADTAQWVGNRGDAVIFRRA